MNIGGAVGGIELAPLIVKLITDVKGFSTSMDEAKAIGKTKADEITRELNKLTKVGDDFEKIGGKLTTGLTLPLIGAYVASSKLAIDFESSFAKVSTLLDEGSVDFDKYKQDIINGSRETGVAVGDYSEAIYQAISASVDQASAVQFTTDAVKLAKGGFTDTTSAVDILTTVMNAYNLETEDAVSISDRLINTQNLGKTTVNELGSSLGRVIPTAKAFGVNFDNVCTTMAVLTKNGIDTAEATTYLNSMLNDLGKSGTIADQVLREKTGKSFIQLMNDGTDLTEVLRILKDYAEDSGKSLGDMFNAEGMKAALTIMKDDGLEFNDILKSMGDSAGAADDAYNKIADTTGEKLKKSWNELKLAGIEFGDAIVPIINDISEGIHDIATWLDEIGPSGQKALLVTTGLLAAAGPLMSITGKGIKLYSTIKAAKLVEVAAGVEAVGASSAVAGTSVAALGTSLASVAGVVVPAAIIVAGVALFIKEAYDEMSQDCVEDIDVLADKVEGMPGVYDEMGNAMFGVTETISEATKKAVGGYLDLDRDAREALMDLYANSTVITKKIADNMISETNNMANQVIAGYKKQKNDAISESKEMFAELGNMSAEEQKAILDKEAKYYDDKIAQTQNAQKQIDAIWAKAAKEHRQITSDEQAQINSLYDQMQTHAVEALSTQESEANLILERMKVSNTRITAEMASENITKLNEQRDAAIDAANKTYLGRKEQLDYMLNTEKSITQEQYDDMVGKAEKQRDDTVQAAQDTRDGAVDKIMGMNADLEHEVDESTGKIKTKWQELMDKWDKWKPDAKTFEWTLNTNYSQTGRDVGINKMATGGLAVRPHLAMIAEGGESEAVIPLSKFPAIMADILERSDINFGSSNKSNSTVFNNNINVEGNPDSYEVNKVLRQLIRDEASLILAGA